MVKLTCPRRFARALRLARDLSAEHLRAAAYPSDQEEFIYVIFEQASEIREVGVGINILPHVIEELAALDLLTKLDAAGIRTKELRYVSRLDGPVDASDAAEEADLAAAQGAEVERQAAAVRLGLPPR